MARETRAREDKVNEKLAAAAAPTPEKRPKTDVPEPAAPAVAAPTTAVEPVASAAPQDDMADAESWDAERVRAYLEPIDAQAAALCVTHSIGGQRLFQLTTRELTELLGLVGMVPRRKVEHAIAKLREPVEALRARKLEEEARSLEGAVPMDRALVHKHLQNGLFVYVTRDDDARCIRFEAENKSHAPPQPLLVSIALTNRPTGDSVHKYFVVPDVQVRVDAPAGSAPVAPRQHKAERRELLAVRLVSNEDSFHWRVTYEVCTIELWLRWENEQKTALVQSSLQTPADASVPDIEYAMIKRGPGVKVRAGACCAPRVFFSSMLLGSGSIPAFRPQTRASTLTWTMFRPICAFPSSGSGPRSSLALLPCCSLRFRPTLWLKAASETGETACVSALHC